MTDRDSTMSARPLRVAVLADMREEGWPSMDLVADMLVAQLAQAGSDIAPVLVRPRLLDRPFSAGPPTTRVRVLNRFWLYRRALVGLSRAADVFHIVDHSYAHLGLHLPPARTVITCHDVDAFTATAGEGAGLPGFLNARLRRGLDRAAIVTCDSCVTQEALVRSLLVSRERTVVIPNGVDACTAPDEELRERAVRLIGADTGPPAILHVGSTIPRKRIDVLLRAFAAVAAMRPDVRLVRVGGPLTRPQEDLAASLGLLGRIHVMPALARDDLHALYRRAALVVSTSEREGFGLPVAEALAAGTPVVVSDIPVFREVAGPAAEYVSLEDLDGWAHTIGRLLEERDRDPHGWQRRRAAARDRGRTFSWSAYADRMAAVYEQLAALPTAASARRLPASAGSRAVPLRDARALVISGIAGGQRWSSADVSAAGGADALLDVARDHGVAGLLWHIDRRTGVFDPESRPAFDAEARAELTREILRCRELQSLARALSDAGCRALFFKGSALAYSHYPEPWMRPRVDTDLLVDRDALAGAADVLRRSGYVETQALSSGALVSHQVAWERETGGTRHVLDVHWRIANPQMFAHALTLDDLWRSSVPLDGLGPCARSPGNVHGFILAAVHRLAHHQGHERLVWLYDMHLLASGFDAGDWDELIAIAREVRLAAVCGDALARTHELFHTGVPDRVLQQLLVSSTEPSRIYVQERQDRIDVLRADLGALAWRGRLRLVREHMFPPVGFMLHRYGVRQRALLPALYAHRLVSGAYRWLMRMA